MGSRIEEFRGDHEKKSELVVTIDGDSGAGKGTLARHIGKVLDLEVYSAGDFFRSIAADKDMSVEELSEKAGKDVDVEVDRRTLEKGLEENCVIESRIASHVLGDHSDFRILMTADLEERAKRILGDLEERETEEGASSLEESREMVKERDRNNWRRYRDYYGLESRDKEMYDLIIDNTDLGVERQKQLVDKALEKRFPERFEG